MGDRLTGLSVLIVEDDDDSRELLAILFEDLGAVVQGAESVAAALAALTGFRPDAIVTDLTLPDGGGYELLARVRQDPTLADVPAIAMTGHTDAGSRAQATEAGFQGFVTKPYDVLALAEAVSQAARRGVARD